MVILPQLIYSVKCLPSLPTLSRRNHPHPTLSLAKGEGLDPISPLIRGEKQ